MTRAIRIALTILLLAACAPSATPSGRQIVNVYASPAAQPWLTDLYDCAATNSVILNLSPDAPQITLRIGPPAGLSTPAFQVGTEDIVVAVQPLSPLQTLTAEQARALFGGQGNASVQVWVYGRGADLQETFDQAVMEGRSVVSSAKVAATPQQMSAALKADPNAIGLLPRHELTNDLRELFVIPSVPVLAITSVEPQGVVQGLIACMQK